MDLKGASVLIWDIDGVLVFVRESYREAIVGSAQYYFSELMGLKLSDSLLSVEDTQRFKMIEGFNDDWKVAYAFVLCLLAKLASQNPEISSVDVSARDFGARAEVLGKLGSVVGNRDLKLDYAKIADEIAVSGVGLEGAEKALSKLFGPQSVEVAKRFWFTDVVKRVFQEIYLGKVFFKEKYGEDPLFVNGLGLIRNERSLVSLKTFEKLSERFRMGVATGRERFEAEYSLKEYGFDQFIPEDLIVASEDVERGKPDPISLLECRRRVCAKYGLSGDVKAIYVGDSVDDVRASKNAGFFSVACLTASLGVEEKSKLMKEFRRLKCDLVLEGADKLSHIVGFVT